MKKQWLECQKIGILSESVCETRAQRDEDRYMFFNGMHSFFVDFKVWTSFFLFDLKSSDRVKKQTKKFHHSTMDADLHFIVIFGFHRVKSGRLALWV